MNEQPHPTARQMLDRWEQSQQVKRLPGLGPSAHGACRRALAFKLHNTPATDTSSSEAAIVGSMLHLAYASIVDNFGGFGTETNVPLIIPYLSRTGEADEVRWAYRTVVDLKSVSRSRADSWSNHGGPEQSVWDQLSSYGLAADRIDPGHDWSLMVVALNRDSGEVIEYVQPLDLDYAERITRQLGQLEADLLALDQPEDQPKDGRGLSTYPCAGCEWRTRCWGQPVTETNQLDELTRALFDGIAADYLSAQVDESEAKKRKERARSALTEVVGELDGYVVKWSAESTATQIDGDAAAVLLEALGEAVPTKLVTRSPRINVARRKSVQSSG